MKNLITLFCLLFLLSPAWATKLHKVEKSNKGDAPEEQTVANCTPATSSAELNINNTRALIQSGGDMWWDFSRPRYEIPKGSGKNSIYAGSLWLAGKDVSGQFKVAALRFRDGNDFWTGPLSTVDAEIDPATCRLYDRHWETTRSMVSEFAAWWAADEETRKNQFPGYSIPKVILEWPAHGRNYAPYNEDYYLAPFHDNDGDGNYDPVGSGDYPGYVLNGDEDCSRTIKNLYGDQNLWWVFNDKGNVHTESGGQAIGMEIRAQAFAFSTTDEVNNMTFYNYELINRSTFALTDTYFGQWVDGDLGNAQDDQVGCDVQRGLGFFYNGDDNDEDASGALGYGNNPPAFGVDFFQGPFQANDGKDNCLCDNYADAVADNGIVYKGQGAGYGDGKVDNERYGMRKFVYFTNGVGPTSDPQISTDYYNMLRGIWKDGTPMTYGGNGYNPSDPTAIPAHYMFPGDSDPLNWGTDGIPVENKDWGPEANVPNDHRFVQSSGPFILAPGAVNNITVGVAWAQAESGGRFASLEAMKRADDKTQALFDSCFEILDGPHAPDMAIQELDREVILVLSNPTFSNNYKEGFSQVDPFASVPVGADTNSDGVADITLTQQEKELYSTYNFEGYQIYQLRNSTVGVSDLENPDKARLVAQVDVKNGVSRLINFERDPILNQDVPSLKVDGADEGISHSFQVKEDLFAEDDNRLINHKTYYYMAVSYAFNNFGDGFGNLKYFDPEYDPSDPAKQAGQKIPYLRSRTAAAGPVRVYEAIPHRTEIEMDGNTLNASYGDGVELKRIEGKGNGGFYTEIKPECIESLFDVDDQNPWMDSLIYLENAGPVQVKVIDPLMVPKGKFTLAFVGQTDNTKNDNWTWMLYGSGIDTVFSEQSISANNEQCITELGISITAKFGAEARSQNADENGFVGFKVSFADETDQWLSGIVDRDADENFNWIKSGSYSEPLPNPASAKTWELDDHFTNYYREIVANADTQPMDTAVALDPNESWENLAGRTWAPFALSSYDTAHPIPLFSRAGSGPYRRLSEQIIEASKLQYMPSVDVVITSDKSKWTRCAVLEAQDIALLSEGGATRGELRRALSVDKDGRNQLDPACNVAEATYNNQQILGDLAADLRQSDKDHFAQLGVTDLSQISFGMGWFPGFAVDVETGERLNMAFAEDSWLKNDNGGDMLWNPTNNDVEELFRELRFGGKHMIYVFRNNTEDNSFGYENMQPAYDGGSFNFNKLVLFDPMQAPIILNEDSPIRQGYLAAMSSAAWVGYPLLADNSMLFGNSGNNDVTISLRAAKQLRMHATGVAQTNPTLELGKSYFVKSGALTTIQLVKGSEVLTTFEKGDVFECVSTDYSLLSDSVSLIETVNKGLPMYTFSTDKLAPSIDQKIGEDELGNIKVVPNPYYAYSSYETGRLDNRIKVINLPELCTISIFTVNGTLVKTIKKDNPAITSVDWDLKNNDGVPIAGGLYIFHVESPVLGETVLKWFGALRPTDLSAF